MSYKRENDKRARVIFETMAPLGPGRRVLDFGAADGWLTARLVEAGHHVVAVEHNKLRDHEKIPIGPDASGTVEWIDRKVPQSELATLGEFDVVIALSVLHWFPEPDAAWLTAKSMARELLIVELPDPRERDNDRSERYQELHDVALNDPASEVVLWCEGWKDGSKRPVIATRIDTTA